MKKKHLILSRNNLVLPTVAVGRIATLGDAHFHEEIDAPVKNGFLLPE